ncbi:4Fe-4S binding protein [Arundinibacter roseus]|uniref:4Fe-4S dicluster domain-containing protein n=1 Tax=Arundinibacter roseus TaxID=2070510 RepID=A0A4R4KQB5_9BACT|nr:4Fe-4S binding protein [Arundinibacter roseus]TDB69156.1 4Fe-4S dicluster domain-containing protein [Arundinibacter roseus]
MPSSYFQHIASGIKTTLKGMSLTFRHAWAARKRRMPGDVRLPSFFEQADGMVTIQYPLETIPIPDNGRYRLHNEMDDCIVCDKCAKVCPVDCIEIEPIKAIEEVGKASDGSSIRLYAAKFDIDMAKCCYCGLCTTVCPTECLTMTRTFDYSEFDVRDMVYEFGNLTSAEAEEKKRLLDQFQKEKEALKVTQAAQKASVPTETAAAPRPAFRPGMKPKTTAVAPEVETPAETTTPAPKPEFKPGMKPKTATESQVEKTAEPQPVTEESPKPKAPFRPSMKPKTATEPQAKKTAEPQPVTEESPKPKAPFRPSMKPKPATEPEAEKATEPQAVPEESPKPKAPFRPSMKPKSATEPEAEKATEPQAVPEESPKPKAPFRPTMKPKPPRE